MSEPFIIYDDYVNQIVIESPRLMYTLVGELYKQINKSDGSIVLSDKDAIIDIAKKVDLTTDFFPFEINRKPLVTKLLSCIKEYAVSDYIHETNLIASEIERYIIDVSDCVNCEIVFDNIDTAGLLKASNVRFADNNDLLSERIIDYCKNNVNLLGDKVFVFVSLRNYLDKEEFEQFCRMAIDNKLIIMLIESCEYRAPYLNTLVIDEDDCVI